MISRLVLGAALAVLSPACVLAQSTDYPVTIENGDFSMVVEKTPERAISLNGHTTEVMLELGLASQMVGTAYGNHAIREKYQQDYQQIPVLGDNRSYPPLEVIVGTSADFTYGRLSAYRETAVATRETLKDFGIDAYAVKGTLIDNATIEDVYEDIRNIGVIFDTQPRAQELIDEMRTSIAKTGEIAERAGKPVDVFVYDSGTDTAFTAGTALQTHLIELAGGENVFAGLEETWANVNWEEVVARAPDVIVVNDYGDTSAEDKIAFLRNNEALASVPAIEAERFVVLSLASMFEGVRIPTGVRTLAEGFHPELFE